MRRFRYALPFESAPILAAGGELKNTFCLAAGRDAWMSQHIGDMGSVETLDAFERSTRQFGAMYDVAAGRVAADAHPGYQTRRWAESDSGRPAALVQHHHAHIASVMAEHGVPAGDRVIGVAFDGTGYGTDGAIWGGEVLVAGYGDFERHAHLAYVPLPGGDATIRKPYRAALAHLWAAGIPWSPDLPPVVAAPDNELRVIHRQLERNFQCVPTSSMGRLFDAVSSLVGLRQTVSFEAQAAIELEAAADAHVGSTCAYRFAVRGSQIDPGPVLRDMVADLRAGQGAGAVAAGFHLAVAGLIADAAEVVRQRTGIDQVALSGGVFQNVLLVRLARAELQRRDFRVITHRVVPPNDGGLSLGQVAVAGYRGSGLAECRRVTHERAGRRPGPLGGPRTWRSRSLTLARRFATGATMWCVAPEWPSHGRHVAVEFVHPVIVGKRALPAVHLEGDDLAGTVRSLARPGDVLLVVGAADHFHTSDLLRRAEAWGLTRFWLGAGRRPPAGLAEHVVWVEGTDSGPGRQIR